MKNNSSDIRRLKQQLAVAQGELKSIKGSRTFSAVTMISHAKNQLKKSPTKFVAKAAKKVASGALKSKGVALSKQLHSKDSIQSQYDNWIVMNEPDATELEYQKVLSDNFKKKPLISIITPVFNPPVDVFRELIDSVLSQTYSNFELCLGDFGDSEDIRSVISEYAKLDSRVKSLKFKDNKGIAENSNQILAKTSGEYIALLDHDDTLSPNALFENVKLINEDDYDFIYSDKDKIDDKGNRFEPFFKPGWSPELMLSANYLTHLNVMKTALVHKVGAWDSTTDGAQDWDLFLKVVSESKKIGHVQKILYHWRVIETSTALSIETKPYALKGQRNAVDYYLNKNNIPAKSYHQGAELLLDWGEDSKMNDVVCFVASHSNAHLNSFLKDLEIDKNLEGSLSFIVLHSYPIELTTNLGNTNIEFIKYETDKYTDVLKKLAKKYSKKTVLFFDDRLDFRLSKKDIKNISGWLNIDGVLTAGPRITNKLGMAVDCGAVITRAGILPLFKDSPPYHQTPIGNIEWIRDLPLVSSFVFTISGASLMKALNILEQRDIKTTDEYAHTAIQLSISNLGRHIFNPKTTVRVAENASIDVQEYYESASNLLSLINVSDPYKNENIADDDPLMLAEIVQSGEPEDDLNLDDSYHIEAMAHASTRVLDDTILSKNLHKIKEENNQSLKGLKSAIILLPDFYAIYAGLNNIFSFADQYHAKGIKITFGIMTDKDSLPRLRKLITEKYPALGESADILVVSNDTISNIPHNDISICTQWATAYLLAGYNKTHRKCYFIQDKEASFYPKGTISALVDNTYKFGFIGLANTPGLLEWYEKEYNGYGIVIKSKVDLSKNQPPANLNLKPKAPYKVFFYARPNEPRNAFELGISALRILKASMGDSIEIFAAGADWDADTYDVGDILTNLGKISYDKVPAFYRSMDAGMMFMFSGHPGVVASELMASGCPVVVNEYDDATWHQLYKHEKSALVSIPTADEVARNVRRCLEDVSLRKVLISGGLDTVKQFYSNYDESIDTSYTYLSSKIDNPL